MRHSPPYKKRPALLFLQHRTTCGSRPDTPWTEGTPRSRSTGARGGTRGHRLRYGAACAGDTGRDARAAEAPVAAPSAAGEGVPVGNSGYKAPVATAWAAAAGLGVAIEKRVLDGRTSAHSCGRTAMGKSPNYVEIETSKSSASGTRHKMSLMKMVSWTRVGTSMAAVVAVGIVHARIRSFGGEVEARIRWLRTDTKAAGSVTVAGLHDALRMARRGDSCS